MSAVSYHLLRHINRTNIDNVAKGSIFPSLKDLSSIGLTFGLTVFAWIFFRAESLDHLYLILSEVFSQSIISVPYFFGRRKAFFILLWCLFCMVVEWIGRENEHALEKFGNNWKSTYRWIFYYGIMYTVWIYGGSEQQFIYFQF